MQWELIISGEPVVFPCNLYCCSSCWNYMVKSLKSTRMGPRVCNHSKPIIMSQPPMSIENIWDFMVTNQFGAEHFHNVPHI
jgi:hypothetical protein